MDYFINPYLWMFAAGFSCAKFFSWLFSNVENNVLKKIKERRKARKILLWLSLMIAVFLLVAIVSFQNPFPLKTAFIFFLCTFFPFFLVFLYPSLFATPMVIVLLAVSAIFADLNTSWIHADASVLKGAPLFKGNFSEEDPYLYRLYTAPDSLKKRLDLNFELLPETEYLNVEIIEIHSLPIWFFWWTNNYFSVQKITDDSGNLLWSNQKESPILKHLIRNKWGWVSKRDTLKLEPSAPASVYWRAYSWVVEYPIKAIPVEEEIFVRGEDFVLTEDIKDEQSFQEFP